MSEERRQSPRQSFPSLVYLDLQPSNGGIVRDLSEGGMQISVAHPLVGAEEIRFSLCLRPRKPIRGTGRIAWISATGKSAGVRFLSLPEETRGEILACLGAEPAATTTTPPAENHVDAEDGLALREVEDDSAEAIAAAAMAGEASHEWDGEEDDEAAAGSFEAVEEEPSSGAVASEPGGGEPADRLDRQFPDDAAVEASEGAKAGNLAASRKHEPRPAPTPQPAWLEALIRAGERYRDEDMLRRPRRLETEQAPAGLNAGPTAGTTGAGEAQTVLARPEMDPSVALYLPNYEAEENRATGDIKLSRFHLKDSYDVAVRLAFERFEEFGWTLERDWHIWLALVLLIAGFLALAQKPPLPVLTGALWLASAAVAVKRKQRPRSRQGEPPEPDRQ